jgi:hypothetical protein
VAKNGRKFWREGKRYRTVFKTIYFRGAEYEVDEEVPVPSSESDSIHTSEDEFVQDDQKVRESLKKDEPVKNSQINKVLQIVNEKNVVNCFGRK